LSVLRKLMEKKKKVLNKGHDIAGQDKHLWSMVARPCGLIMGPIREGKKGKGREGGQGKKDNTHRGEKKKGKEWN